MKHIFKTILYFFFNVSMLEYVCRFKHHMMFSFPFLLRSFHVFFHILGFLKLGFIFTPSIQFLRATKHCNWVSTPLFFFSFRFLTKCNIALKSHVPRPRMLKWMEFRFKFWINMLETWVGVTHNQQFNRSFLNIDQA